MDARRGSTAERAASPAAAGDGDGGSDSEGGGAGAPRAVAADDSSDDQQPDYLTGAPLAAVPCESGAATAAATPACPDVPRQHPGDQRRAEVCLMCHVSILSDQGRGHHTENHVGMLCRPASVGHIGSWQEV